VSGNFSDKPLSEIARNAKLLAEAQIRAKEAIGYDAFFGYAEPLYIPEAFGCKVRYTETGPLVEPLPLTINDLDDLAKIPSPDPRKDGRLPVILETVSRLSAYASGKVPVVGLFEGAFTTACRIIEVDLIMRMILRTTDILQALLLKVNHFLLEFGRALLESGANVILMPEPTASSSMISPRTFKALVLPRIQSLTSALGAPCLLHICGNISPILDFMAQSGADVLSLEQCMNLLESRQRAPNVALGGNVDPTNTLLLGNEKRVVENTLNCLRSAGTSRFVLMSGCGVPPDTPIHNLRAMVRTAVDYGLGSSDG
jgi:uroporphyrinogen decarboxylase